MKISVRLYRAHDMDLVTLYRNPNFSLQKAIKTSLRAYVEKRPYLMYAPTAAPEPIGGYKSIYQCFINLDDTYDSDIIAFLKNVKPRMRTALLKQIVRGSIVGTVAYGCLLNDVDVEGAETLEENIRSIIPNLEKPPIRNEKDRCKIYGRKRRNSSTGELNTSKPVSVKSETKITKNKTTTNIVASNDNSVARHTKSEARTINTIDSTKEPINNLTYSTSEKPDSDSNMNDTSMMDGFTDLGGFGDFGESEVKTPVADDNNGDFDMFGDISKMLSGM